MRTVVLASADAAFRARLRQQLTAMRWSVREAGGGAEAMAQLESEGAEAMVLDSALPDLEVGEFAKEMRSRHPVMDLVRVDVGADESDGRSPRRNELLHALRQAQMESYSAPGEGSSWSTAPVAPPQITAADRLAPGGDRATAAKEVAEMLRSRSRTVPAKKSIGDDSVAEPVATQHPTKTASASPVNRPEASSPISEESRAATRSRIQPLPEMVGESTGMVELARLIRLVAPRSTTVLIEGATGTGKELVAKAVHRLSTRASKPYLVLNCAAIPEALLEAELFGHTRGAFTGAVQSRTGRIEAANGGTLFLDEIGEMPLALQAKMLRFLESGELQRVGDNETIRVDVRVVAASHQPLQQRSSEGAFRLDLYHRLAVFPVSVPALRDRMEDVPLLVGHILGRLGEEMPVKRLSTAAAQ
ncbi:MAG TPA: sigma-54 dependent transcriptional regulator, partial [Acidobacteriaceae bacterium]|nr:sigma-54 dependent transcriptional regulator [Acidobacteriaceae bacterium]